MFMDPLPALPMTRLSTASLSPSMWNWALESPTSSWMDWIHQGKDFGDGNVGGMEMSHLSATLMCHPLGRYCGGWWRRQDPHPLRSSWGERYRVRVFRLLLVEARMELCSAEEVLSCMLHPQPQGNCCFFILNYSVQYHRIPEMLAKPLV